MLQRFDSNGDGQLDSEEREAARAARPKRGGGARQVKGDRRGGIGGKPGGRRGGGFGQVNGARRQAMLQQFDTNKDGQLDTQERNVVRTKRSDGRGQRIGQSAGTGRGRANRRHQMFRRFDRNNDGQLDAEERQFGRSQAKENCRDNRSARPDQSPELQDRPVFRQNEA